MYIRTQRALAVGVSAVLRNKGITEALIRGISNDEWTEILIKADNNMYDLVSDYAKLKLKQKRGE